jgi:hypothetical protein
MSGPAYWADVVGGAPFGTVLYLNGTKLEGGGVVAPFDLSKPVGPAVLSTGALTVTQHVWLGGNIPVNIHNRLTGRLSFTLQQEADYWLFAQAAERQQAVALWMELPWSAEFYIPANTTQTWRLGRETPWDLVGVSQATHPARAYIDGVEKTVVTGSPSPGEVRIPDSGGYVMATTNSADTAAATWLTIRYHPELRVVLSNLSLSYAIYNDLRFDADLEEVSEDAAFSPAQVAV